jgi:hypothetical protein
MKQVTYKISSEVVTQEIAGETVVLDLNSESYFGLDQIGTRLWQLLQQQKDFASVTEILLNEYDVEEKQLKKDLEKLLAELVDEGLILLKTN